MKGFHEFRRKSIPSKVTDCTACNSYHGRERGGGGRRRDERRGCSCKWRSENIDLPQRAYMCCLSSAILSRCGRRVQRSKVFIGGRRLILFVVDFSFWGTYQNEPLACPSWLASLLPWLSLTFDIVDFVPEEGCLFSQPVNGFIKVQFTGL